MDRHPELTLGDLAAAAVAKDERVTLEQLEEAIVREDYYVPAETTLTICTLVLASGFTVTGESACAVPANFNAELGKKFAREAAIRKLWGFLGFALAERRHAEARG